MQVKVEGEHWLHEVVHWPLTYISHTYIQHKHNNNNYNKNNNEGERKQNCSSNPSLKQVWYNF